MHPFLFRLPALGVGLLLLGLRIHAAAPAVPIAPAPGIPALLQDAMKNSAMHEGHWAFTQTDLVDVKVGKETKQQQTIFRFDPSKPYAEQFTPQLVEGHPPTAADLKKYRQNGEDRAKDLEKQQKEKERLALKNAGKLEPEGEAELRKYVDVDHISLLAETATEATYAIPMRKGLKAGPLKLEKLELVIRISTADRVLTGLTVRLLDNVRLMLVANVKSGEFSADFVRPDPAHGPIMARLQGAADASFLFKKFTADVNTTRKDFAWVTPYDERFKVQIGPLRAIGF